MKRLARKVRSILRYFRIKFSVRRNSGPIKIVVGAARNTQKGWLATEEDFLNLLRPSDWRKLFRMNQIDAILAEHVWEHLTSEEGLRAAKVCFKYLKKGGYLRVAVPDGFQTNADYINYVKGANIGGFIKVADSMLDQGVV